MPSDPPRLRAGAPRRATLLLLAAAALAAGPSTIPGADSPTEYQVKAVFLYHFTHYLRWPEEATADGFEIAVLGDSAILPPLAEIAARKTVAGRPILIRPLDSLKSLGRPQVLFVARPAAPFLRRILEEARAKSILTVGEEEGLAEQGLAVNFVLRDGAVKFEVNEEALRAGGIQPGAQLLKLAILVDGPASGGGP
jgi:hypothetical protein